MGDSELSKSHSSDQKLISKLASVNILLLSPLLKWYLLHGLKVTRMYGAIKAKRNFAMAGFREYVANGRRKAAACGNRVGKNTKKVMGNSAYRGLLINVEKHRKTLFAKEAVLSNYVYYPLLQDVEVHPLCGAKLDGVPNGNISEFTVGKKKFKQRILKHFGYAVLQYAKLMLLEFVYDMLVSHNRCLKSGGAPSESGLCVEKRPSSYGDL